MSSLTDLPSEIVLHIVGFVPGPDLEALTSTCRRFLTLAARELDLHREKKRRFSTLTIGYVSEKRQSASVQSSYHPLSVLQDLLEREEDVAYTRTICIGDVFAHEPISLEPISSIFSRFPRLEHKIIAAFAGDRQRLLLDIFNNFENGHGERCFMEMCREDHETIIAFLIAMLPNLERIKIYDDKEHSYEGILSAFNRVYEAICKHDLKPVAPYNLLELIIEATRPEVGTDLLLISHFFGHPQLRKIRAHGVWCNAFFTEENREAGSIVKHLEFTNSQIGPGICLEMLRHTNSLETFRFQYRPLHRNDIEWAPHEIINHLQTYTTTSLKHMELVDCRYENSLPPGNTVEGFESYPGTLVTFNFEVLETLRLQALILRLSSDRIKAMNNRRIGDQKKTGEITSNTGFLLRSLVEFLPASVIEVSLVGMINCKEALSLVEDLAEGKPLVPALKKLVLEDVEGREQENIAQAIGPMCEEAGVALVLQKSEEGHAL